MDEAIELNKESGKLDSIEEIGEDGTVVFTDYAYEIMKDSLGFDCQSFHVWDSKELAFEQMECFRKLTEKYMN